MVLNGPGLLLRSFTKIGLQGSLINYILPLIPLGYKNRKRKRIMQLLKTLPTYVFGILINVRKSNNKFHLYKYRSLSHAEIKLRYGSCNEPGNFSMNCRKPRNMTKIIYPFMHRSPQRAKYIFTSSVISSIT